MSLFTRISSVRSKGHQVTSLKASYHSKITPTTLRTPTTLLFNRNFHNSPKVFNKDQPPKKAPVATATATVTQKPQAKTTAVVDTAAKTVVRAPESLEDVKNNIALLLEEEIQTVKDQSMAVDIQADFSKQFLAKSKYEVTEGKDGEVVLLRTHGSHTVKVIFNKSEPQDDYEDESMQANEEEEGPDEAGKSEEEDGEANAATSMPSKQSVQIEITFADKEGKWVLGAFAGKDNRLYIEDMSISRAKDLKQEEEERLDALPFETLSDDLQDRIYDFLDEVAVDDQLAHFVKHYTAESETKAAVSFLENLRGLLKK